MSKELGPGATKYQKEGPSRLIIIDHLPTALALRREYRSVPSSQVEMFPNSRVEYGEILYERSSLRTTWW